MPIILSYSLVLLAWLVMMLGAYTRLTDAGLGCPDWPGCYGQLIPSLDIIPTSASSLPSTALSKAWTEMIHRYLASTLGLAIIGMALYRWRCRKHSAVTWVGCGLVGLQGLLGMWTVTWQLYPLVVLAHLIGGLSITSLLWYQATQPAALSQAHSNTQIKGLTIAIILVLLQIMLGGWLSANYAALACTGFPTCNGLWWPPMDWQGLYLPLSDTSLNYEGGILSAPSRIGLHMLHRGGALLIMLYCTGLALYLFKTTSSSVIQRWLWYMLFLLFLQITLGIINVIKLLPITVAVAHHGVATLFLLTLLHIQWQLKRCF